MGDTSATCALQHTPQDKRDNTRINFYLIVALYPGTSGLYRRTPHWTNVFLDSSCEGIVKMRRRRRRRRSKPELR
jgi:predicted nucleic acid-binding Zn ribbon protein